LEFFSVAQQRWTPITIGKVPRTPARIGPQQYGVGFDSHRVYTTNLKYISFSFATDAAKATAHRDIQSHSINQQRLWQYNTSPSSSARYG
jgi:hypothetical protein